MRAVMEARPNQCNHCRQRLWLKPNESVVICPGCKLQKKQENYGRLYKFDYSSTGNEILGPPDKGLRQKGNFDFNFIWRGNDSSPKSSLNIKPSPLMSRPSAPPKKCAVLIGVTCNKAKYKLKGTINDVKNMRELLINSFGFKVEAILVLTEEEAEEQHKPTKKNIQKALQWLVEGSQRGDSLVFYFGGHGLRQPDFNGDELDGY
ncbi:hypothetical protein Pint_32878 [Pistacia integerrima]|uniref:Uncharacterized protein n=1 Tax=Pistacia integerrima TaxID=434235 RepID=A0ACC0X7Q5_9ROSI|nr:hypothetical protein Pint_32878 [Pistacia integerrima]